MEGDICVFKQSLITSDVNVQQRNIFALFPLIYGVPSIILCILVVKLLLSKHGRQEFNGRFYLFYAIASISVGHSGANFFMTLHSGISFI
jgi:uncharacterized membrane protein